MAFGGFDSGGDQKPMAEINMVPLIDVMLVLLVIFIITAPLLTHSVKIDLPKASSNPNITKPEHVQIGIRQDGRLFWNGSRLRKPICRNGCPRPPHWIRSPRFISAPTGWCIMKMSRRSCPWRARRG